MNTAYITKTVEVMLQDAEAFPEENDKDKFLSKLWETITGLVIHEDGSIVYRGAPLTVNEKQYVCDQKYVTHAMQAMGCAADDIERLGPLVRKIHTIAEQMCIVDKTLASTVR